MKSNFLLVLCLSAFVFAPAGKATTAASVVVPEANRAIGMAHSNARSKVKLVNSLASVSVQASRWQTQTFESIEGSFFNPSIAVDASGQPHIAYQSTGYIGDIKYRWFNGITWTVETVDTGFSPSLALDANGHPHIAYYNDFYNPNVRHAWHDGTSWHIDMIDQGQLASLEGEISLKLDVLGHPFIAYENRVIPNVSPPIIKFAAYDGTSWISRTVDPGANQAYQPSLTLDKDSQPHIAYIAIFSSTIDLVYSWLENNVWQQEIVESDISPSFNGNPSLQLDSAGQPHISYSQSTSDLQQVKHAWRDQLGWHSEWAASNGFANSLALDSLNQPHIGYATLNGSWRYAWRDWRGRWHSENVDVSDFSGGSQFQNGSLVLNGNDVHASFTATSFYPQFTNFRLAYAVRRSQPELTASTLSASASTIDPGSTITYTIELVNASPISATTFAISNPAPTHTTYLTHSVAAISGQITATDGMTGVTWTGVISPMTVLTANFAVLVDSGLTETLAIVDVATLEGDPIGPLVLQAVTFHKPYSMFIAQSVET